MKIITTTFLIVISFLRFSTTQAQVLHLGMTRDEIVKAFPNYIRKDKNGNIDTSAAASNVPYLAKWLTYPIVGNLGKMTLYFDTDYSLRGYEWRLEYPAHNIPFIASKIHDSLIKIYDSTRVIIPKNQPSPGFIRRTIYYKSGQKVITVSEDLSSILYSEGELIDIIIVPPDQFNTTHATPGVIAKPH